MSLTIKQALARAAELKVVSDSWQLDTELLLAQALATTRTVLHTWPERVIEAEPLLRFESMLERRANGEPIAYILGRRDFWDFQLIVNSHVLIPRPETELLVECALELVANHAVVPEQIADLGTGSGAIAIALSRELPQCKVSAIDLSVDALAVAQQNVLRLQLSNIIFHEGSWCEGLSANSFDLILANPPYVAEGDAHLQQGDLRFEPTSALVAPDSGLGDIKSIVTGSRAALKQGAWLLLEHGYQQGAAVAEIFRSNGFSSIECRQDYAGLDRVTLAQWLHGVTL